MAGGVRERYVAIVRRLRRFERREVREFRAWIENTRNLIHLTVLVVLPAVIGGVTALSNALDVLPFLLFPPLASGTYTLFANPEAESASIRRFVGGLTTGAVCGWLALELSARFWYRVDPATFEVHAGAAAFGVFLTGVVTWLLGMESASAYSSALLVLVTDVVGGANLTLFGTTVSSPMAYVGGVFLSASLVAGLFIIWRNRFYEQRARYLYLSTKGDDRVLVPMRGQNPDATSVLGARLAAAHDAGKVVLLSLVETTSERPSGEGDRSAATVDTLQPDGAGGDEEAPSGRTGLRAAGGDDDLISSSTIEDLERQARQIETDVGVPCQVAVATIGQSPATTVQQTARETGCDLICTPYETRQGRLAPFVRELFAGETDVLVHRSEDNRKRWRRILVPVRRAGDTAHNMLDFATRLAGPTGHIAVCHCIADESRRRGAERMLADLVETVEGTLETRVSQGRIEDFLGETAGQYDLVILGASTDRSAASRFVSPPTFERLRDVDSDVAIVDRNFRL